MCPNSKNGGSRVVSLVWPPIVRPKAAQFVDLLGFSTSKTPSLGGSLPGYEDQAVTLIKEENQLIIRYANAVLYNGLYNKQQPLQWT